MARRSMKAFLGFLLLVMVGACQQAPSIPAGLLPPGEPPNDNNQPAPITGITTSGQTDSASSEQSSASIGSEIVTHLPSASPAGVTQLQTGATLSPGD